MQWSLDYVRQHFVPDIRQAFSQLALHRLRSALTLLGMVFGVGAVIAMLAVSEGGRREALKMIEGMGLRNIIVEEVRVWGEEWREMRRHSQGLSVADAHAIVDTMQFITKWAGARQFTPWGVFSPRGQSNAQVSAVSPSYFEMSGLEVEQGRFFDAEDDQTFAQVAVIGNRVAQRLFPNGNAVGDRLKVDYLWLEVVGVVRDRNIGQSNFQGMSVGGESDRIYLPLQTGLRRLMVQPAWSELSQLKLEVSPDMTPATAASVVEQLIERRHGGQEDTRIVIPARLLAQQQQTQRIFTIVMSAVAGISLLVGGIGIMNIMLASVMERRSEIGLLRALGARQVDVIRQFLIETTVIALAGAFAGVLFGIGIAYGIAVYSGWDVAWSVLTISLAVIVCVAIAVGFGVYPAMSAAKLDPVTALQAE